LQAVTGAVAALYQQLIVGALAAMTNNGLPPLMLVSPNGQPTSVYIPTSNGTHPDGTPFADFSPEGPPIVDSDGSAYIEYEVRYVTYPPKVLQAVLYLLKIAPNGSRSDITLNSTTEDTNLMPGRIIPDGQGGVLATWTISPSSGPPSLHPYQASHVVDGSPGTPYDLPFSPQHLLLDIGEGESRERGSQTMRKLTGEGLYLHDDAGGKRGRDARPEVAPPGRADAPRRIVCAIC